MKQLKQMTPQEWANEILKDEPFMRNYVMNFFEKVPCARCKKKMVNGSGICPDCMFRPIDEE